MTREQRVADFIKALAKVDPAAAARFDPSPLDDADDNGEGYFGDQFEPEDLEQEDM